MKKVEINTLYEGTAKLADVPRMMISLEREVGLGEDIILTGPGPIWLYLLVAHALHGLAKSLRYDSPAAGEVVIFDHDPY